MAVEEEAAASGESAAFGFVGRGDSAVRVLEASGEGGIKRVEVARVEGRIGSWGSDGDGRLG